jgi:stage V sporulation protein AE
LYNNKSSGKNSEYMSGRGMVKVDWMMIIKAFLVGGIICVIGQLLIDYTAMTPARILVLFVTLGVALTAVGLYDPLVKFAGGGATVPLLGFGYSLAKGTEEAVKQNGLLGALTGGVTAAAGGIAISIFLGFLCALVAKSHDKS